MSNRAEVEEIWKQYPNYDFIEASNLGRVKIKDRYVPSRGGKRLVKGHVLKQYLDPNGYMYVEFSVNGKSVRLRVHRVIAASFFPNPDNLPEVNHIDCDPTNNRLDNLEWCTHQENIAYRGKLGHTSKHKDKMKPVIAINPDTFEIFWFESQNEAARQLHANSGNISEVVNDKRYRAGGYWFCYADENAVEKVRERFGDKVAKKVDELMKQNKK